MMSNTFETMFDTMIMCSRRRPRSFFFCQPIWLYIHLFNFAWVMMSRSFFLYNQARSKMLFFLDPWCSDGIFGNAGEPVKVFLPDIPVWGTRRTLITQEKLWWWGSLGIFKLRINFAVEKGRSERDMGVDKYRNWRTYYGTDFGKISAKSAEKKRRYAKTKAPLYPAKGDTDCKWRAAHDELMDIQKWNLFRHCHQVQTHGDVPISGGPDMEQQSALLAGTSAAREWGFLSRSKLIYTSKDTSG